MKRMLLTTTIVALSIFLAGMAAGCTTAGESGADGDFSDTGVGRDPSAPPPPPRNQSYEGRIPLRDVPPGLDWLNVDRALSREDFAGKVTIIDFWTYGCVNCIHMIPVLEHLEEKYARELVVIGVHSAKFANEGETENINQVLDRYGITHPVVNDRDFRVWRTYGIQAWPSFLIVDPAGNVVGIQAGEIPQENFDRYIGDLIEYWDRRYPGTINRDPVPWQYAPGVVPARGLSFPEGLAVDPERDRLFVSDTGNDRIVEIERATGTVTRVIGGEPGFRDGELSSARFHRPRGLALDGDTLYVADGRNHAVRAVNLSDGTVSTVAGTGERAPGAPPVGRRFPDPPTVALATPWDVAVGPEGSLYIAVAGVHQIWSIDPTGETIGPVVGSGHEAALNGVSPGEAALAQPSGVHPLGDRLYFADSESSTVRVADFGTDRVRHVAGTTENDLFTFGDVDGGPGASLLQHPLGITAGDGMLYIADTYNDAVKRIDPETGVVTTISRGGDGSFDEPSAIDFGEGRLYVADTNNHAIRTIDIGSGAAGTLRIANPAALRRSEDEVLALGGALSGPRRVELPAAPVPPGPATVRVDLDLPDGFKINPQVESFYEVSTAAGQSRGTVLSPTFEIPISIPAGGEELRVAVTLYYCEAEDESYCLIDDVEFVVPLRVNGDSGGDAASSTAADPIIPLSRRVPEVDVSSFGL